MNVRTSGPSAMLTVCSHSFVVGVSPGHNDLDMMLQWP